jgi:hypothetical protein
MVCYFAQIFRRRKLKKILIFGLVLGFSFAGIVAAENAGNGGKVRNLR